MLYKPDWDMTKKRFEAFWNREILDRCMVAVTARKDRPVTSEYPPLPSADLVARWTYGRRDSSLRCRATCP